MKLTDDELQTFAEEQMIKQKEIITDLLDKNYHKKYTLDCRVKTIEKLKLKQSLYSSQQGYALELTDLPDIVGFRISVENESEVIVLSNFIGMMLQPSRVVDYFNKPRETGFKAFLLYFENEMLNTEIQIMTEEMRKWTNATHDEHNERKYGLSQ